MKKWNELVKLEIDLSNNEIDDDDSAEVIAILSDLENLTELNMSLWNNEIGTV